MTMTMPRLTLAALLLSCCAPEEAHPSSDVRIGPQSQYYLTCVDVASIQCALPPRQIAPLTYRCLPAPLPSRFVRGMRCESAEGGEEEFVSRTELTWPADELLRPVFVWSKSDKTAVVNGQAQSIYFLSAEFR